MNYHHVLLYHFIHYFGNNTLLTQYVQPFQILAICPPGQNPNLTDTSQCIDCEVGYFSSVNASDQCEVCHSNYTTPSTGSTMESDCKSKISKGC